MTKTTSLYISEKDAPIFERAKELLGEDSLSRMVGEAVRRFVEQEEKRQQGFESIELEIGTSYNNFNQDDDITTIRFTGRELASHTSTFGETSSGDDRGTTYTIYQTAKGQFLLHEENYSRWQNESNHSQYEVYPDLKKLEEDADVPKSLIQKAKEALGEDAVIDLDI